MPDENDILFARAAVKAGFVDLESLTEALRTQVRFQQKGEEMPLERILLSKGHITREHRDRVQAAIRRHRRKVDIKGFEIYELIGKGAMGTVYRARQLSLDRIVALKLLPKITVEDPRDVKRFLREARLAASLNHKHIVKVFEVGQVSDRYFISMEFVTGRTLEDIIDDEGALPAGRVLDTARQACQALVHAHEQGVVHRDLKPGNIMITPAHEAKIVDFGLAVGFGKFTSEKITQAGIVLGTPEYIPPEQARAPASIDEKADIYSLGAVMYHGLAGREPFAGTDVLDVLGKVFRRDFPPLREQREGLPEEVYELVEETMAFDRGDRPSAPKLSRRIQRIFETYPRLAKWRKKASRDTHFMRLDAAFPPVDGGRRTSISAWQAAVLALLLLGAGFFVVVLVTSSFSGGGRPSPARTVPGSATPGRHQDQEPEAVRNQAAAEKLLLAAREFMEAHPEKKEEAIRRLKKIVQRYPGTLGAYKARDEIARLQGKE